MGRTEYCTGRVEGFFSEGARKFVWREGGRESDMAECTEDEAVGLVWRGKEGLGFRMVSFSAVEVLAVSDPDPELTGSVGFLGGLRATSVSLIETITVS